MELHAVVAARLVGHAGDRAARRRGHRHEARRQLGDAVAVAHPDVEQAVAFGIGLVLQAVEQPGVAARPHPRRAELAVVAPLDRAAELRRHGLHAVADAEHRHAGLPHRLRRAQLVAVVVGAGMAARQHDALRREAADEVVGDVVRMDLAVDLRLAHASGDELRDLRAEVEDEDLVVMHRGAGASGRRVQRDEAVAAPGAAASRWRRKCVQASASATACSAAHR